MRRVAVIVALTGVVGAMASLGEMKSTTIEQIDVAVKNYPSWKRVNHTRFKMADVVAMMCRTVTPEEYTQLAKSLHFKHFVEVFVNAKGAKRMFESNTKPYPVGTVIVKAKFSHARGGTPELLTVMRKRETGFDTKNGDWEYAAIDPKTMRAPKQEIKHCQSCHQEVATADFVYGSYVNR